MEVSVCIATYRRPDGLSRLLRSLELQRGNLPDFEIVIVDNDATGSAAKVCAEFADRLRLRYLVEASRGIAAARNRAVAASAGRFLAFIDDDEEADPNWLTSLRRVMELHNADGVFGPVVVRLAQDSPAWISQSGFFDYPALPTGAVVPWYWTRTSNAYVRRDALPDKDAPFDRKLDLIGGEDVDLFARMIDRGARFIAAADAVVFEYRSTARSNFRWMIRRSFRNGGTFAHVTCRRRPRGARFRFGIRALGEASAFLLRAIYRLGDSRIAAFRHCLRSIESLGKAAWAVGLVHSEYRLQT
ncbi:MAG: glycosyltransferase family 2 protein [Alphaproteobacteria bacterium]